MSKSEKASQTESNRIVIVKKDDGFYYPEPMEENSEPLVQPDISRDPDTGYGKSQRKKGRRGRAH